MSNIALSALCCSSTCTCLVTYEEQVKHCNMKTYEFLNYNPYFFYCTFIAEHFKPENRNTIDVYISFCIRHWSSSISLNNEATIISVKEDTQRTIKFTYNEFTKQREGGYFTRCSKTNILLIYQWYSEEKQKAPNAAAMGTFREAMLVATRTQ